MGKDPSSRLICTCCRARGKILLTAPLIDYKNFGDHPLGLGDSMPVMSMSISCQTIHQL